MSNQKHTATLNRNITFMFRRSFFRRKIFGGTETWKNMYIFFSLFFAKGKSILLLRTFVEQTRFAHMLNEWYDDRNFVISIKYISLWLRHSGKIGDPMRIINLINKPHRIATFGIIFCFQIRLTIDICTSGYDNVMGNKHMSTCYIIFH